MATPLTITGVTRMTNSKVCISAVTDEGEYIRPVITGGIDEYWLRVSEYNEFGEYDPSVIRPFARVELSLADTETTPPHCEDKAFSYNQVVYHGLLNPEQQRELLDQISDPAVSEIFGADIHRHRDSCYVLEGEGERSLGTVKAKDVRFVNVFERNNGFGCRLRFKDENDSYYNLPVTDLSLLYYIGHLHEQKGLAFGTIGAQLQAAFSNADTYIRIGLGRGFYSNPNKPQNRCYLLISGVFTFPDYLDGKCFVDFQYSHDAIYEDEIPF